LLSSWCGVGMALAFISVFGGMMWHLVCCLGLRYCSRPGAEQFPVPPGQWFIVAIYPCAFTCGCSFYCAKSSGHLDQF